MEILYIVNKESSEKYRIIGMLEREYAHAIGARHVSVVIVPYVSNGADKGKWLVLNRYTRQIAKGKKASINPSWNLFGGHCNHSPNKTIGTLIDEKDIMDTVLDEIQGELLTTRFPDGYESDDNSEVCDAITRLWEENNKPVLNKLRNMCSAP